MTLRTQRVAGYGLSGSAPKDKKITEYVVVRDYGKQGLAIFDMNAAANPGRVCGYVTYLNYEDRPKGFRPDNRHATYGFEECDIGYFHKGRLVRPGSQLWKDTGADVFLDRYKRWALSCYAHEGVTELEIVVVQKDQQKYRNTRWKR